MTPALWVSLAGLVVTLAGWAVTYGAMSQKVRDLESRVAKCEDRHGETAGRIGAMEVDMAVLKERSGTTISALDRIEAKLEIKARAARRTAT